MRDGLLNLGSTWSMGETKIGLGGQVGRNIVDGLGVDRGAGVSFSDGVSPSTVFM